MSSRSSKSPMFRMFNPSGRSKEESVEKRREQVRRAQHVYRARKTRYVKALEGDLASSRRRETDLSLHNSTLEAQVKMLLRLLESHSIASPDLSSLPQNALSDGMLSPDGPRSTTSPEVHPEWPQAPSEGSPLPSLSRATELDPVLSLQMCEFDQTAVGMQFVLKIEEPCLGHVHGDPARPEDPSNHALTVTSQLLCISSIDAPKRASLLPVQDVPSGILNRLLDLAPAVSSEDELTPVQAWDALRRRPLTGSMSIRTVLLLAEKLRDTAKCHGFGAVLDHGVFNHLLGELMKSTISSQFTNGLQT